MQPIYNSKANSRKERSTLSIAIDVIKKIEAKVPAIKSNASLFNQKKKVSIKLKHHEADMLELLLLDQIRYCDNDYLKAQIQKTIDFLNQKLA